MDGGDIDILVGTQMIAKGLDFKNLNLVGLILADVGFNLPDFRATERFSANHSDGWARRPSH